MRVLLLNMPPLLRDIILAALEREPDMAVVIDAVELDDLAEFVLHSHTDVVMTVMVNDDIPVAYRSLMYALPSVMVVGVAPSGERIATYGKSGSNQFAAPGPDTLLRIIRADFSAD